MKLTLENFKYSNKQCVTYMGLKGKFGVDTGADCISGQATYFILWPPNLNELELPKRKRRVILVFWLLELGSGYSRYRGIIMSDLVII